VFRGEGLVSLARPFLAAGSTSVVGTLWNVEDDPTRTLVRSFHREFAQRRDAAGALGHAQRVMLNSARPADRLPRSWAGFVAVGAAQSSRPHE
jgi:CHAT domain-containing protein